MQARFHFVRVSKKKRTQERHVDVQVPRKHFRVRIAPWLSEDEDARTVCSSVDQQKDPTQTGFTDTAEAGAKEGETEGGRAAAQKRQGLEGEGKAEVTALAQGQPQQWWKQLGASGQTPAGTGEDAQVVPRLAKHKHTAKTQLFVTSKSNRWQEASFMQCRHPKPVVGNWGVAKG